ncbi:MAG: hypothetical protein LBC18_15770 [Opitutaceae bacterium]|jgi:glycerol kinase|nr:hypothetical protein [Opitutaceae bacterium]
MPRYAAIDQGTTSTRVIVLDETGALSMTPGIPHRQIVEHRGWVEHDPLEILGNIKTCLERCGPVDAIGLAHQGESVIAWDAESGAPLCNAIVWQDQRTAKRIEAMKADGLEPLVQERCGLPLDSYFSASKLGWILENVERARPLAAQGRLRMGTMDAFFNFHLCGGAFFTDYNSASRTSLFNIHTLEWDRRLCELFGVPDGVLPEVRDNACHFGDVKLNGRSIPFTACIVDQFGGTYGHGCTRPGQMKITFGTGAFLQAITGDAPPPANPDGLLPVLCWKIPGEKPLFGLDGGVYNAASAVNWVKKIGLFNELSELTGFPEEPAIKRGVAFVPALSGLACPHWDRSAAGLWAGLSLETGRMDLLQSVLEGVAVRAAEVVRAMDKTVPVGPQISIDGGLSSDRYFKQFLADLLQKEIHTPSTREMTAYGVALLARRGLGIDAPFPSGGGVDVVRPRAVDYSTLFEEYKKIITRSRGLRN